MADEIRLPDPRRYGTGAPQNLNRIEDVAAMRAEIEALLERRANEAIRSALSAAPSHSAYQSLWRAISDVANHNGTGAQGAVVARLFALPVVIVIGSRRPVQLAGVLPDIAAVSALFKQHGALGPAQNFGLGNALCSLDRLEDIMPDEVYAWTRDVGAERRELPPSEIASAEPGEHVHLRFIVGAAIAPAVEPSFVETASNIGNWGMPLTRVLSSQMAQPNVEVLPLARPPMDLLNAAPAGRYAQLETAFNLFGSNAVRRLRGATGDPDAVISAHDDGDIRVCLTSPFDGSLTEGFRWPLHPLDSLDAVIGSIAGLLADCRITNVRCSQTVLPALDRQGNVWFARTPDAAPPAPSTAH